MDELTSLPKVNFFKATFLLLWENILPLLFMGLLLFITGLIPFFLIFAEAYFLAGLAAALLLTPGWTMLLAQENYIANENSSNLRGAPADFGRYWWRSFVLGLIQYVPLIMAYLTLTIDIPNPVLKFLSLAVDTSVVLTAFLVNLYALPLIVQHNLKLKMALRNGMVLVGRYLWRTLGLTLMGVAFAAAIVYITPASLLLMFILPPIWGMFIVNNSRDVIEKELKRIPKE